MSTSPSKRLSIKQQRMRDAEVQRTAISQLALPTSNQVLIGSASRSKTQGVKRKDADRRVDLFVEEMRLTMAATVPSTPTEAVPRQRPKGKGNGHHVPMSVSSERYLALRPMLLNDIFTWDVYSEAGHICQCGGGAAIYDCEDCHGGGCVCAKCLEERHQFNPFHRHRRWNGSFFERMVERITPVHLGHNGYPCPNAMKAVRMKIGHTTGVFNTDTYPCGCHQLEGRSPCMLQHQLMRMRIIPSAFTESSFTWAFTTALMDDWMDHSHFAKTSCQDFLGAIWFRTDGLPRDRLHGYDNFRFTARVFRDLRGLQRSGQAHGIDAHLPENRWPGSVAVVCPACPEPDFNLQQNWQELSSDIRYRYLFQLMHAIDGNFKAYGRLKPFDEDDLPFTDGSCFFPKWETWRQYCAEFDSSTSESGTCPAYDKMHAMAAHSGKTVSGLCAIVCARHGIFAPLGMVDLHKGEKYSRMDHCWAMAQGPRPDIAVPRLLSSDRGCSLSVNFVDRLTKEFPTHLTIHSVANEVKWVIPKLHITGHTEVCQYKYHLAFTVGAGRTDGESIERSWVETKHAAVISRDASPAMRADILNDEHNWWNYRKTILIADYFRRLAIEAQSEYAVALEELRSCEYFISKAEIASWEREFPTAEATVDQDGSVVKILHAEAVVAEDGGNGHKQKRTKKRSKIVEWICLGIDAQKDQIEIRMLARSANSSKGPSARVETKRQALGRKLGRFSEDILQHAPELKDFMDQYLEEIDPAEESDGEQIESDDGVESSDSDDEDEEDDDDAQGDNQDLDPESIENQPVLLPSHFTASELDELPSLKRLADAERKLRKAHLDEVKRELSLSLRIFSVISEHSTRPGIPTRSKKATKRQKTRQRQNLRVYQQHQSALARLGMTETEQRSYPPLSLAELLEYRNGGKSRPRTLGEGRKANRGPLLPWLMMDASQSVVRGAGSSDRAGMVQSLSDDDRRVHYFRIQADCERWAEQVKLIGADWGRAIRHMQRLAQVWTDLAKVEMQSTSQEATDQLVRNGRAAYASKKAQWFRKQAEQFEKKRLETGSRCGMLEGWSEFDHDLISTEQEGDRLTVRSSKGLCHLSPKPTREPQEARVYRFPTRYPLLDQNVNQETFLRDYDSGHRLKMCSGSNLAALGGIWMLY
ncbi:hypothetical protein BKA62DRAFT_673696 [Auriculariales sp. MPI-PUGE-AT-0066]|nr:hypothetical protein BKA62DRAFT_673696 [Auriculariales sp. MPI-PUGE-AT-0066]